MKFFFSGTGILLILLLLIITSVSFWLPVPEDFFRTTLIAIIISWIFVAGGFLFYVFALKFRQKAFNKVAGISILGRLFLMAVIIVTILLVFHPNQVVFLITLFISYFLFQIWEVISLNQIAAKKVELK